MSLTKIDDYNQLWTSSGRKVRDGISREDSERIVEICDVSRPGNVALDDWFVLVSILSKVGIVDLENEEDDYRDLVHRSCWNYRTNNHGRIQYLTILGEINHPFDLPPDIGHLRMLNYLEVDCCRSLCAKELSVLPHLNFLRLTRCRDLLGNFPLEMELKHLKSLHIVTSRIESSSAFLAWMVGQLPELQDFALFNLDKCSLSAVLEVLSAHNVRFRESLRRFTIACRCLDNNHLVTLFTKVLPKLSNLSFLHLKYNKTQSIQTIAGIMKSEANQAAVADSMLCKLHLSQGLEMERDDTVKKAVLHLARTFRRISLVSIRMGYPIASRQEIVEGDEDIQYELLVNEAGRSLVENTNGGFVPLSTWPAVLEKAAKNSNRDRYHLRATGLYYLLRSGPMLQGIQKRR